MIFVYSNFLNFKPMSQQVLHHLYQKKIRMRVNLDEMEQIDYINDLKSKDLEFRSKKYNFKLVDYGLKSYQHRLYIKIIFAHKIINIRVAPPILKAGLLIIYQDREYIVTGKVYNVESKQVVNTQDESGFDRRTFQSFFTKLVNFQPNNFLRSLSKFKIVVASNIINFKFFSNVLKKFNLSFKFL
jgi:hypothetical protein